MRRQGSFCMALCAAFALAGCGGGGGGGSPGVAEPATVGVLITDAPSLEVDEALATITSVELLGASGPVVLFSGSQTLDLLKLRDFSELFAVSETVPPGTYSKIRLRLSALVLNRLDPATGAVIESTAARLAGNGKIDLNPRGPFVIGPGDVIFVEIDFDMEKSLKITTTGSGGVIVRPVVFVDIRPDRPGERLARIYGQVSDVDAVAGTLRLCQTDLASRWDDDEESDASADSDSDDDSDAGFEREHCLAVSTDAATGVFDAEGLPQDFGGLESGELATVIGRLSRSRSGEFRLRLDAFVIEEGPLGTYRRIAGTAASAVDAGSSRFDLDLAPGQGFGSEATLAVQLFEQSRIFNRRGEELRREDIESGRRALVDGVLQIGAEDLLRSPLVVLDLGPPAGDALLQGSIVFVDLGERSLIVNDGVADRCVTAGSANVFLVSDDDGLSAARGELEDLRPGQAVSVFGVEGVDSCIAAGTIIADED